MLSYWTSFGWILTRNLCGWTGLLSVPISSAGIACLFSGELCPLTLTPLTRSWCPVSPLWGRSCVSGWPVNLATVTGQGCIHGTQAGSPLSSPRIFLLEYFLWLSSIKMFLSSVFRQGPNPIKISGNLQLKYKHKDKRLTQKTHFPVCRRNLAIHIHAISFPWRVFTSLLCTRSHQKC